MGNHYYTDGNDYRQYTPNNTPNPFSIDDDESSFNIMEWVARFLKFWYLFVAAAVVAMGLAYVKNRSWKPEYLTESKIIIESSSSANQYSFMQGFGGGMDLLNTNNQLLILGSYDLINRAASKLPFSIDYYTRGRFKTNSLYAREPINIELTHLSDEAYMCEFRFIPVGENSFEIRLEDEESQEFYPDFLIKAEYGERIENALFFARIHKLYPMSEHGFLFRFRSPTSLEDEFSTRLALSYIGEASSVVGVSLTGNNVIRDRDFLNMLGQEFLSSNLEEKNEEATRTIDFINDQMLFIADSLKSSEVKLRQYQRENNMIDVNGYTSTILNKLSALDAQRSELNLKEAYFDNLSTYLNRTVTEESLVAPSSLGISDPILLELVNNFNDLQQRRSDVGVKNPNYDKYSKKMEEVRKTLLEVLSNVRNIHAMERRAFEKEYNLTLSELKDLPEKELAMINFERAYKVNDNYYTFLLQKQSEAQIRKASNVPDNKILQKARISPLPVNGGDKMKVYLIFLVVGLMLPAIFVVLKELLNVTIHTENDIQKITKIPILGNIRRARNSSIAMSIRNPKSLYTEGYRMLRTRIGFIVQGKEKVVITVTSAESGDGKTHFAQDLAGIYGMISDKVVLIDIDIRNPKLSKDMGNKENLGLVHAIIGNADLKDVITRNEGFNYDFIPAGIVPPNPSELLNSSKFKAILEDLKQQYDYVIIDTSPLGLVSDAYALCSHSDVNLLITRSEKSNKNIFANFTSQVTQDRMDNVYIVLNDVPVLKKRSYGYSNYAYGKYSYASDYYQDEEKKYYDDERM